MQAAVEPREGIAVRVALPRPWRVLTAAQARGLDIPARADEDADAIADADAVALRHAWAQLVHQLRATADGVRLVCAAFGIESVGGSPVPVSATAAVVRIAPSEAPGATAVQGDPLATGVPDAGRVGLFERHKASFSIADHAVVFTLFRFVRLALPRRDTAVVLTFTAPAQADGEVLVERFTAIARTLSYGYSPAPPQADGPRFARSAERPERPEQSG